MMHIEYRTGDLFKVAERVLVHGCNAQGRMGSGVAKLVRDLHPLAYATYQRAHREHGLKLGEVVWALSGTRIIGNAIMQAGYGHDGARYVDYRAIREAMRTVNAFMLRLQNGDTEYEIDESDAPGTVGMPLIGAGLGGGHWPTIAAIIEDESAAFRPVVYTLDGVIPS